MTLVPGHLAEEQRKVLREVALASDGSAGRNFLDHAGRRQAQVALKEILGRLRPEPVREPRRPLRHYEPPSTGRYRRRR